MLIVLQDLDDGIVVRKSIAAEIESLKMLVMLERFEQHLLDLLLLDLFHLDK